MAPIISNELGRLANVIKDQMKSGTETIFFIRRNQGPVGRKVAYGRIITTILPQKTVQHRVYLAVGRNLIDYPGNVRTPTADMTTAKLLFNSVVSTPSAKFMTCNINDIYLNTPIDRYEYMRLPIGMIPKEIIEQYNLLRIMHNGYVYIEIQKGMYNLSQSELISNLYLKQHLTKFGYAPTKHTTGLWRHKSRPITLPLVVDNFRVKYKGEEHTKNLIKTLESSYKFNTDWKVELYCIITLK